MKGNNRDNPMLNFGVFGHIYRQFNTVLDIFNTNAVNLIIVITVICMLHNNLVLKYRYHPSLTDWFQFFLQHCWW